MAVKVNRKAHGYSFHVLDKQGDERASFAGTSMWMKPVARMVPAPNKTPARTGNVFIIALVSELPREYQR